MPDVTIKLESIGDDHREHLYQYRRGRAKMNQGQILKGLSMQAKAPFVKIVTGVNHAGKPTKRQVMGHKDYTEARGAGSRGIFYWHTLRDGECYQIQQQLSWNKIEKMYVVVHNGRLVEATEEQVVQYVTAKNSIKNGND